MKKIPMIAMMAAPYVLFCLYMAENITLLLYGFIGFIVVMTCGAIYAFFLPRAGFSGNQILFWCMLLKISNIPVFLFIFIAGLSLFVVIIPLIPILILFDLFLLASTSMYGVSGLLKCGKERRLSKKEVIINILLQFVFCADLLSAIYCYIKSRKVRAMTYTLTIYLFDGRLFFTGCLNLYFDKYKGIGPAYYDRPIMVLPQNCSAEDLSAAIQHCVVEMQNHKDSIYQDNLQSDIMQMDKRIFQNFKLFGVSVSRKRIIQQSIGILIRKRENDFMLCRCVPEGQDMVTNKKLYLPPDSSILEVSQIVLELLK